MKWSPKVEALEARCAELGGEYNRARLAVKEAKIAECGVAIGDIVESCGIVVRVTKIETQFSTVWVSGNPRKKDGTFGTSIRNLYGDWRHLGSEP